MSDDEKKIIVDDDWKAEARREKEDLSKETEPHAAMPEASFAELLNIFVMQAMAGLGMMPGAGGEQFPPNMEVAKHFIDLLQVLEDKTKNNLEQEEQKLLAQVLYDLRMRYVQLASGGAPPPPGVAGVAPPMS